MVQLAIIDVLQEWSIMKKFENLLYTLKNKSYKKTISAVPPADYQSRFHNFLVQSIFKPGLEKFTSNQ